MRKRGRINVVGVDRGQRRQGADVRQLRDRRHVGVKVTYNSSLWQ